MLVDIPKSVNLKLSENLRKALAIAIESGYADNSSDFIRKATISKLEQLGIFSERVKSILLRLEQTDPK